MAIAGRAGVAALLLACAISLPVAQAADGTENDSPESLAREGIQKVLDALELFLGSIPQYSSPEVLENGDIIIRRKHNKTVPEDDADKKPEDPPALEKTRT